MRQLAKETTKDGDVDGGDVVSRVFFIISNQLYADSFFSFYILIHSAHICSSCQSFPLYSLHSPHLYIINISQYFLLVVSRQRENWKRSNICYSAMEHHNTIYQRAEVSYSKSLFHHYISNINIRTPEISFQVWWFC